ncbi:MAG TPA: DUF1326 domain-containing protein [Candidatus Polarisedimenticolia bacterium]|nr:DUF1326 domain-containing protein [Candidatus Polarisedimenticolia bacterium]
MKRLKRVVFPVLALAVLAWLAIAVASTGSQAQQAKVAAPDWALNGTVIEACSCQMFCPCYFSTKPAPGDSGMHEMAGGHYCRFNIVYKINKGHYGATDLAGAKVWIAGDLGDDFGDGQAEWAEVTFDPAVTKPQRDGIAAILTGQVYPLKWKAFTVGQDAPIEWNGGKDRAVAKLDGGKAGEVVLVHNPTAMSAEPSVIKNVKYFGAPRNDGFILMPNEVQAYRRGDNKFESKGTNGFMLTLDINSKDAK